MASTSIRSTGCSASQSCVKRESIRPTAIRARSSGGYSPSRCNGYEGAGPPGDVHTRASRSTRSGQVTANSWATMPPKLTPTTRHVSHPT